MDYRQFGRTSLKVGATGSDPDRKPSDRRETDHHGNRLGGAGRRGQRRGGIDKLQCQIDAANPSIPQLSMRASGRSRLIWWGHWHDHDVFFYASNPTRVLSSNTQRQSLRI
jgi:hypothetical protein